MEIQSGGLHRMVPLGRDDYQLRKQVIERLRKQCSASLANDHKRLHLSLYLQCSEYYSRFRLQRRQRPVSQ
jgi:hypothetical protein